jgi:hypothetical protein
MWRVTWKLEYWKQKIRLSLGNGFAKRVSAETNHCRSFLGNDQVIDCSRGNPNSFAGNREEGIGDIWRELWREVLSLRSAMSLLKNQELGVKSEG